MGGEMGAKQAKEQKAAGAEWAEPLRPGAERALRRGRELHTVREEDHYLMAATTVQQPAAASNTRVTGKARCNNPARPRRRPVTGVRASGFFYVWTTKPLYASSTTISAQWLISERASAVCAGSGLMTAPHSSHTVNATIVRTASSRNAPDCRE